MIDRSTSRLRCSVTLALAVVVCLTACGSDDGGGAFDDAAADVAPAGTDAAADGGAADEFPVGDDSDLVVPLDYLQGEWCNTDGEAWAIDGETARVGENHDELFGELPVALAFSGGSERVLVSRTADEFVLDVGAREVTFTRGRC